MIPAPAFTPTAFIGAMALLAAFGCGLFFEGYQDIIYAPGIIALLVFSLLAVLPGCWRGLMVPTSFFALSVALFWLYITLSLSWTTIPFASLVTYLIAIVLPLTFFSLLMAQDRIAWLSLCASLLMVALTALAGWAVIQGVFLQELFYRAQHPLQNPNSLGALLNLPLFAVLPVFLTRDRLDLRAGLGLAAAGLFFAGILATESRGALFATCAALPIMFWLMRSHWRKIALLLAVLTTIFGAMHLANDGAVLHRITHMNVAGSGEDTMTPRKALWDAALDMAREHPLTGTGLGTFYLYYPAHRAPLVDNSAGSWVHNDPLQFAVEMGWAAPVLFYIVLLAALLRTISALKHAGPRSQLRPFIVAPFCALITLAIDAHVSFPLYLIPITICAAVLLAVWYEATMRALAPAAQDRVVHFHGWQQSFVGIMAIAVAAMLGLMAASSAAGAYYLQQARTAIKQGDFANFVIMAETADRWGPPSFIDPHVHLAGLYIDMLVPPAGLIYPD
ncbi:MAG: O-antigen ligase family protein, partial [Alphaproteobacteria bacterium]|nr:O-antigen ligase family protein [Alphaproteobacteria bacterium]